MSATLLVGWEPAAQEPPVFRSGTHVVPVFATVQDRTGRLVAALPREAFQIRDNGRPVDLVMFSNDPQPITAVLLVGAAGPWVRIRGAVAALIDVLEPRDRVRLATFGAELSISPHLTADRSLLRRIVREELWLIDGYPIRTSASGDGIWTPGSLRRADTLWPAMRAAVHALSDQSGRRVLLVVAGGQSELPSDIRSRVEREVIDEGFMVYAVSLDEAGEHGSLTSLAERTGGGHADLADDADVPSTLSRIAEELRSQYLLGFVPAVLDGRRHRIEVTVADRSLTVRARREYLAEAR